MSHKDFLHLGREVAKKMRMPYFSILVVILILCELFYFSFSLTNRTSAAVDLGSIVAKCTSGSFSVDCAQSLPDIKTGIQTLVSSRSFSKSDAINILKAVGTLAINLFLVIVNTIAGILKGLLPFLK